MKIAIPTEDRISISGHFGRTAGFMIYELEEDRIIDAEYRSNTFTRHHRNQQHKPARREHNEEHQHHGGNGRHDHSGIMTALSDCEIVIARGMGRRLYDDLKNEQKRVFVTREHEIKRAIEGFINNELDDSYDRLCHH